MKRILRNLSVALLCGVLVAPSISAQRRNNGETNGGRIEQRSSSRSSSSRSNRESNNSSRNNNSNRRQNTNSNNRNNSSTSQRPGFNSNNNNRPDANRPNVGNNNRPNNRPDANRPNVGNNDRPNNRPDANRPNVGNNDRPNNRPDANRPNMGNNGRPNNRPDANRPNVGNNNRPNNRPDANRPNVGNNGRPNSPAMNRPGHDFGPNSPVAGHHQHFTPKRPPHRPYRPPMIRPVHRPMPPVGWRPTGRLPIIRGILGLTFGTAINLSLDYLFNNGYTIDGYTNDIVYLRNISALNYIWTDAALYYGNNGFDSSSFYYSSPDYNLTRYNNVYNSLVASYGMPVSVNNSIHSMSATWFGGNNGYITLSFGENTINHRLRYLTTLTFGL